MAKTKEARKKKRTSKHILEAKKRQKKEIEELVDGQEITATPTPNQNAKKLAKKMKVTKPIKDPKEAHSYLSNWKHREASPGLWKFNKNTQSWIFRHMYDTEMIPKASFETLLEYLNGLQGSLIQIVNDDALSRAMRYKEWEKKGTSSNEENENIVEDENNDSAADDKIFYALSDHDKRKSYKRARKVIETLKKAQAQEN